jgi:hypothetical protein
MAFDSASPKPGPGRPKGTGGAYRTKSIEAVLDQLGVDPIREAIKQAMTGDMSDCKRAQIWLDIASYVYAKPKEVRQTPEEIERQEISKKSTEELLRILKEKYPHELKAVG